MNNILFEKLEIFYRLSDSNILKKIEDDLWLIGSWKCIGSFIRLKILIIILLQILFILFYSDK